MFTDIQRIFILVFTITASLHLGSADGFTAAEPQPQTQTQTTSKSSSKQHDAVEAQISTTPTLTPSATYGPTSLTTTTLASSNAPATTIESTESRTYKNDDDDKIDDGEAAATTVTLATTLLPEIKEKTIEKDNAATFAEQEETTVATTRTETTNLKTEQGEGQATTTNGDGNEVRKQIKSTENDMKTKQELQLQQMKPATKNPTEKNTNEQETTTTDNIMAEATKTETLQATASVEMSTIFPTTKITTTTEQRSTEQQQHLLHPHVDVQTEGRPKNGLYRITVPEVVTDEFGTVPSTSNAEKIKKENEKSSQLDAVKTTSADANVAATAAAAATKVNIADLYPMKKEDFEPIIRDSNKKLLKERTLFKKLEDEAEYRQNLLPNEVESNEEQQTLQQHSQNHFANDAPKPKPQHLPTLELTLMSRDGGGNDEGTVSDFTGKLLAEQDGIITEIEQKFRLSEFVSTSTTTSTSILTTPRAPATKNELTTLDSESTTQSPSATVTAVTNAPMVEVTKKPAFSNSNINNKPIKGNTKGEGKNYASGAHDFIERRVKKSFAFPMHRAASDAMSAPYTDFANTKFTGSAGNGSPAVKAKTFAGDTLPNGGNAPHDLGALVAGAAHPEFSTTKFYNSKELYNEMVMHNKLRQLQSKPASSQADETYTHSISSIGRSSGNSYATTMLPGASSRFSTLKNVKNFFVSGEPLSASMSPTEATAIKRATLTATTTATMLQPALTTSSPSVTTTLKPKKFQKELKRAKLLLKAILPDTKTTAAASSAAISTSTATKIPTITPSIPTSTSTLSSSLLIVHTASDAAPLPAVTTASSLGASSTETTFGMTSQTTTAATSTSQTTTKTMGVHETQSFFAPLTTISSSHSTTSQLHATTNPTKSALKPIARPRVLSSLQEKINSLECELQNVPQDSHLWRGNETHELLLPIVTSKQCDDDKQHKQQQQQQEQTQHQTDCSTSTETATTTSKTLSWDGEAEIQSGDILIVEINDASLLSVTSNTTSAHNTQVYQVTRSGHEHCDVTEGILLDITPLVVDGRKLVTLYDKDLTEGVNLLIVVSELWGTQCIRLKVTTKTDNCGENADCSGKGVCYSNPNMEEYECQCCTGFAGPHCEEIDACTPSPCTNNGICVDLSQGHEGNSYQCLCPYGYTGKNCQYESDPCNPAECMNGGTCIGNSTHFRCDCTSGFAGPLCQHSLNECESSPCVHGICVDQEDGFRCFCQPGFAGELCNFEYNECESNPCQNGGECIDHIGSFECRCTKGYSGVRCETKVDFCANKPCPEGHRCIDHGNDFSCECPGGRNGPDCNQMARTRCNVNPCTHGGTCWSSGDSFYCACRPGFTGAMCEDEFVVETVVSSSEFIVDDTSTRNFNDKSFGSSVVLKSPIELHSAYFAAGVLAAASFIVAVVVTICHCKVNQTYRKFSTRTTSFIPIIGFGRRPKPQNKLNKHWLSGKGVGGSTTNTTRSTNATTSTRGHLTSNSSGTQLQQHNNVGQLHERPFQRHLAMNLENDMYYTVDFSENSQHSPLIQ